MSSMLFRFASLLILLGFFSLAEGDRAAAQGDAWHVIKAAFDDAFKPLPVKRMFGDPDRELGLSRRAPYTSAKRNELDQARAKARLRRAQIMDERRKREEIVTKIGAYGGLNASRLLIRIYELQLADIDRARKVKTEFDEAARIDINPGVDPGGVYWERWLGKERGALRLAVKDEEKIRDMALEECAKLMTPDIRDWLISNGRSHEKPEVREQMVSVLAATANPQDAAALGGILESEREVWARVMILNAIGRAKSPGAAPFVLGALADEAWPVRLAAVSALRSLGLRDAAAVDALIGTIASTDGRVRFKVRNALCEATGQPFGLEPEEWKLWWGQKSETWAPPDAPAQVAPLTDLPRLFGAATASKRIAVLINRGSGMLKPVKKRLLGNDGNPPPPPAVDSALAVAIWELGEGLATLPADAEFIVILYGSELHMSSKKLRRATKGNRQKAVSFAARFAPEGGSNWPKAFDTALRLGVPGKVEDRALAGIGDVDTVILIGGGPKLSLPGIIRLRNLRQIEIRQVNLSKLE